ncbi:DUF4136 domain-containing protein [Caulobacter sp. 17J65-9]|uniref:DUF4136 domain-containing protein n=1 Tax=Caulobacter sp. 17J65-9 TaxID=2709382 RepID=UPI0013CAA75B|nr:DUF4136 domain-containing protein [Caulobacter sp. 17J65-9]NEX92659.1 DUF4136 domain-containing protein [Caulobacter sp. 17J65-9]
MSKASAALLASVLLGLAGCATEVTTETAPNANMSAYRSYAWNDQAAPQGMSPVLFDNVRAVIDRDLQARGFARGPEPDFTVSIELISSAWNNTYDYYDMPSWYFGWGITPDTRVNGSLMITVYDAHTQQPIWHGKGTRSLGSHVSQSDIEQIVDPVVAQFPAGSPPPSR